MLGVWWSVTTSRREQWMADPRKRRMAYDKTLHFLVPGLFSQLAILGLASPIIWRVTFVVAAVIRIAETKTLMATPMLPSRHRLPDGEYRNFPLGPGVWGAAVQDPALRGCWLWRRLGV